MTASVVLMLALTYPASVGAETVLHVSVSGNDTWSGSLANPDAARTDGPLGSLSRAIEVARQTRDRPVRIVLHEGTHVLGDTITLGPQDSELTIKGLKDEETVVSGGRRVTAFKPWKGEVLQADLSALDLPDLDFRELYCDGKLMPWARVPNFDPEHPRTGGFLQNDGLAEAGTKTKFRYPEGSLEPGKWAHPERAWMMFHDSLNYETQYCPAKSIDPKSRIVEAQRGVYVLSPGNPFYLCGLLEELDAPGEWCVDPDTETLYFWPPAGDPNAEVQVVVPAIGSAFVFEGNSAEGQWVEDVRIARLAIRNLRGRAIQMNDARRCTVAACDLRNAQVGVYLGDDTHECQVLGCDITQTQGDGVSILGTSRDHERVADHVVDNCYIWDFGWGRIHNRCGGVYMHRCARIKVTHNHIHDGPRYAIGMDVGNNCEIAYNYGHHVNLVTCDTSIIEAATAHDWGLSKEEQRKRHRPHNWFNTIHHNLIHDAGGWGTDRSGKLVFPHYSWGIYLDVDCCGWHIHHNVCYNTVRGGFMLNAGTDNVVDNNVFVDGQLSQIQWNPWPGYTMERNRCERNIFAYQGGSAQLYALNRYEDAACLFERNVIHSADGSIRIGGVKGLPRRKAWEAWQEGGHDEGSILADPLFIDGKNRDYRLQEDSEAFALGFGAIDLSTVGNYAHPDRRTWPRPEEPVARDPADYSPLEAATQNQPTVRDYEDYAIGEPERNANVGIKAGLSSVAVTDETAATGARSLKVTEKPGLPNAWEPYITYWLEQEKGRWHGGFDLRWQTGAEFVYEWRDDPYTYNLGPQLRVDAAGKLLANGERLADLPAGEWVRLDVTCALGERATGKYDLTLRLPDGKGTTYAGLACAPKFDYFACAVVMSMAEGESVFYLDNMTFEPLDGK